MFGIYDSFEGKFGNRDSRGQNVHSGVNIPSTTPTVQFTIFVILVLMLYLLHSFVPSYTRFRHSSPSLILVAHFHCSFSSLGKSHQS
jgi:hypothetical protein